MGGDRHYHPGIDGIRAVAVALVLVFHSGLGWMPGGFLGVSVFFTLSGFLITGLLLAEIGRGDAPGRVSLRRFWGRRARRLAPASLACLLVVALAGPWLAGPAGAAAVRGDVVAALAYVANWRFVLDERSYAELFSAPSPVLHFWSLAIEEQFYLLFPLVIAGLAWVGLRRRGLGVALAAMAVASTLLARVFDDPDRVYYGTDTRAAELLIGAVLACVAGIWLARQREPTTSTGLVSFAGLVALGAVVALSITTHQGDAWLYRGGLAAFAGLSGLLVGAAIVPGPTRSLLSLPLLVAIGRVSYGIYLFHWPLFVWLTPARIGFGGVARFAVLTTLTVSLAVVSHRFLEQPVRQRRWPRPAPVAAAALATAMVVVAAVALTLPRRGAPPADVALFDESATPVLLTPSAPPSTAPPTGDTVPSEIGPSEIGPPEVGPSETVPSSNAPASPAGIMAPLPTPSVLVVGSDPALAGSLRDALARAGTADGIEVIDRSDPTCPVYRAAEVVEAGSARAATCPDFREAWIRAVADVDPDAVVAGIGAMERLPYRLSAAAPVDDLAVDGDGSVRLSELGVALDVLDSLDPPAFLHDSGPAGDTVALAVTAAATTRPSILTTADLDRLATEAAGVARAHAAEQIERPSRWLVVGDSTARSVAAGLAAGSDGRVEVVSAGVVGCPVVRAAVARPSATETRTLDYCPSWDTSWPGWLDAYDPDALVVVAGTAEQWPLQLPGDDAWHSPGDQRYVEWHDAELSAMLAIVADRGLPILVLDAPAIDTGQDGFGDEPEAVAGWNAQIERWDRQWAAVGRVPYATSWSDPRSDAGRRERPDGVHPAPEVMEQLARASLIDVLLERQLQLEKEMRRTRCLVDDTGDLRLDLDRCRSDAGATADAQAGEQSSPVGQ